MELVAKKVDSSQSPVNSRQKAKTANTKYIQKEKSQIHLTNEFGIFFHNAIDS
jgi:hypothetical protein